MILPLFCSCLSHYCARGIGTPVILPIEFSISLCYNSRRQVFGKGETMMAQRERKLTEKELKRKENFEKLCSEMEQNGYKVQDLTFSVLKANLAAIFIMLPFIALIAWLYYNVSPIPDSTFEHRILFLFVLFCTIIIHELIHGITCAIFSESHFHAIAFGIIKPVTFYCTCTQPLKRWQIILGFAMPALVLGFGFAAVSIKLNSFFLFFLSELNFLMGSGDFFAILKILLYHSKDKETLYCVHPYKAGLVVFEK